MDRITDLQLRIESRIDPSLDVSMSDRLSVIRAGDDVHLDFYGEPFGEAFGDLMDTLSDRAVAESIASIELRGPDEGANGTRNWDLTSLAESDAQFPRLRRLCIEQTKPGDHNRTIVAASYEEGGVLAGILRKSPELRSLVTPSAPSAAFFQAGARPLEHLSVDAGYDHQSFVANLARTACLPKLRVLEFGEFHETYEEDFETRVTPFADYQDLWRSPAMSSVRMFRWRNPACTAEQLQELRQLRPACQMQIVRWSDEWLR